ncbi:diacylglycerol kinase family protein [Immundisolibacter sp.]|uniref:diacylglycerol kinase family protein n=1 Tax=Immundisolibacter sp. TaxID=1934948 RepID=UPI0026331C80|nr:diacylglycerol kinase family protein [Immundisolibacter sp.]MDD3652418.1 diacylglycerol kinase family protein [Immundisolibacter sp.]
MADTRPIGVLSNPASRYNARGGLAALGGLLDAASMPHRLARTPSEIERALEALAAAGVRRLVINGGDGTVQAALTVLALRSPFAQPPAILVLAGGTTNQTAYDLGSHGQPAALLRALLTGRLTTTHRRVLAVRETDGVTRCGFFLTAGGLPQAVRECRAFRAQRRLALLRGAGGTALWVAGRLARLLGGRLPFAPQPIRLQVDDGPAAERAALLLLATTHRRLALGLTPWWGKGDGPLHVTTLSLPARRLALALPGLLRGRPPAFATPAAGYASQRASSLHLAATGGYALDGEDYFPPAGSTLAVSAGPEFEFLRP